MFVLNKRYSLFSLFINLNILYRLLSKITEIKSPLGFLVIEPKTPKVRKIRVHYLLHSWDYIIASSLFYYINSHCYKFATSYKEIAPTLPT